mgnify:CR=1 FL=1
MARGAAAAAVVAAVVATASVVVGPGAVGTAASEVIDVPAALLTSAMLRK